jgi:hypothetical protein
MPTTATLLAWLDTVYQAMLNLDPLQHLGLAISIYQSTTLELARRLTRVFVVAGD